MTSVQRLDLSTIRDERNIRVAHCFGHHADRLGQRRCGPDELRHDHALQSTVWRPSIRVIDDPHQAAVQALDVVHPRNKNIRADRFLDGQRHARPLAAANCHSADGKRKAAMGRKPILHIGFQEQAPTSSITITATAALNTATSKSKNSSPLTSIIFVPRGGSSCCEYPRQHWRHPHKYSAEIFRGRKKTSVATSESLPRDSGPSKPQPRWLTLRERLNALRGIGSPEGSSRQAASLH